MTDFPYPEFDKSFIGTLEAALEKYPERECLRFQQQTYSYLEVDKLSSKIANQLISGGFEKGMHGAVYSLNSAIAFIAALGIIRAGGVWIPVNARNSVDSNRKVLVNLGCSVLFYQGAYADVAAQIKSDGLCEKGMICLDENIAEGSVSLKQWTADTPDTKPTVNIVGTDLLTLPQTGGTTGLPKGVMISHRNFSCIAHMMCNDIFEADGTMMCAAPMTHVGGRFVLTTMPLGLRYVVIDKIDPQIVLNTIQQEKITDLFLPPTAIYSLLDQPNLEDFDLSSLRILGYGSAPMNIDRLREAIKRIGPVMAGGFGQTECPMSISNLPAADHFINGDINGEIAGHRLSSVGRALSCTEIGILDDDQNELPTGERGEIGVKSGAVSEGYYQAPEQTAEIRKKGWHLTGDIGYLDEEGFLYIVDRKKDMIITGGFNVYPAEVEQMLMSIPGVKLAAVIGLPDEKWGEVVTAFLEVEASYNLTADDIINQSKAKLGGVKAPKAINFVDELPRTALGKLDKKALQ